MASSDNPLQLWATNPNRTYTQTDQNWLNTMRHARTWVAGTYLANQVTQHEGTTYIATATTSAEPGTNADWEQITSRVYVQDAVPTSPRIGDWHITQTDVPPKAFLWTGSQWLNFITQ